MALWFRFYQSALEDPRIQRLPGDLFKSWVNLLCLTSKNNGILPSTDDIAFALRITVDDAILITDNLLKIGLLEFSGDHLVPTDWHDRQFLDKTNAQRQRNFRHRQKGRNALHNGSSNALHNGPVTSQDTDTDTDTDNHPIQGRMLINSKSKGDVPWN